MLFVLILMLMAVCAPMYVDAVFCKGLYRYYRICLNTSVLRGHLSFSRFVSSFFPVLLIEGFFLVWGSCELS